MPMRSGLALLVAATPGHGRAVGRIDAEFFVERIGADWADATGEDAEELDEASDADRQRQTTQRAVVRVEVAELGDVRAGSLPAPFLDAGEGHVVDGGGEARVDAKRLACGAHPRGAVAHLEAGDTEVMPSLGIVGCAFDEFLEHPCGVSCEAGIEEELAEVDCPTTGDVIGGYVRRYLDMVALANDGAVKVIGETGIIRDKPGFEVDFLTRANATGEKHAHDTPSVLMPVKGHWRVDWDGGSAILAPGDTMSVPENLAHSAVPSMTGEAAMYHVIATDDPAGRTWQG